MLIQVILIKFSGSPKNRGTGGGGLWSNSSTLVYTLMKKEVAVSMDSHQLWIRVGILQRSDGWIGCSSIMSSMCLCVCLETGSCCVAQAALELSILLAQSPKWEYQHEFYYTWLWFISLINRFKYFCYHSCFPPLLSCQLFFLVS